MVTAYIDESGGSGREMRNVYILVATIPLTDRLNECRDTLLELKPREARKLHWYEAGEAARCDRLDRARPLNDATTRPHYPQELQGGHFQHQSRCRQIYSATDCRSRCRGINNPRSH
jgi:hypothetical protein